MTIRLCTIDDLPAVAAFYDDVTKYLSEHINYPKWTFGVYPCYNSTKEAIEQNYQYVCIEDDAVLGAFILNTNPDGAYEKGLWSKEVPLGEYMIIHTLAVRTDSFNKGIAKIMVSYALDYARLNGMKSVRLDVVPTNTPARRLYEGLGFKHIGDVDLERNIEGIPKFSLYEYDM